MVQESGVIPSAAAFQAERGISQENSVAREIPPAALMKARAVRDDANKLELNRC